MRDFRDAKAMARTLRDNLNAKSITISHSESLELVSRMLGLADWNTLSAQLQGGRPATDTASYPAVPLRDLVPFPTTNFPTLFVGREKSKHALGHALERLREVVLVTQRDGEVDDPGIDDVHEVGVLARVVELWRVDLGEHGHLKVQVQTHRRVTVRRFFDDNGAYRAEVTDIREGPIPEAPFLIKKAAARFESYAAARGLQKTWLDRMREPGRVAEIIAAQVERRTGARRFESYVTAPELQNAGELSKASQQKIWPQLDRMRDPGRVADIIAMHVALPISDKQSLLATLDPVARLERVYALMDNIPQEAGS